MASSEYIGLIRCAHCGNENATVHRQTKGTKKGRLYYRCYTEINGRQQECGTIQCIGPAGQKYVEANMRPLDVTQEPAAPAPVPAEDQIDFIQEQEPEPPAPVPVPEPATDPAPVEPAPKKKSFLDWLAEDDEA